MHELLNSECMFEYNKCMVAYWRYKHCHPLLGCIFSVYSSRTGSEVVSFSNPGEEEDESANLVFREN